MSTGITFPNLERKDTYRYGRATVHVLQGDITQETTDCIVNGSNLDLDLSFGAVSKALVAKAGPDLVKACKAQIPYMKKNGVALTSSGKLKCMYVLHINAYNIYQGWSEILKKCLDLAGSSGISSLSIPALGTGDMNLSAEKMAKIIAEAIKSFWDSNSTSSLTLIRLVIFDNPILLAFTSAFADGTLGFQKEIPKPTGKISQKKGKQVQVSGDKEKALYFIFEEEDVYMYPTEEYHYRVAESQFFRFLGSEAAKYSIEKVEFIHNKKLKDRFRAAQLNLKEKRGEQMSQPVLAFHGTDADTIKKICENGFLAPGDAGFVKRVGNKFGDGVYLSEYPQYCMNYLQGSNQLLLCQVLTGKLYPVQGEWGILLGNPCRVLDFYLHRIYMLSDVINTSMERNYSQVMIHMSHPKGKS